MVIIKLYNIYLPIDFVLRTMVNRDWEVSSIIKDSEFSRWNLSSPNGPCSWFLNDWFCLRLIQTHILTSDSPSLLQNRFSLYPHWILMRIWALQLSYSPRFAERNIIWKVAKNWIRVSGNESIMVRFPLRSTRHGKTFLKMIFQNHLTWRLSFNWTIICWHLR